MFHYHQESSKIGDQYKYMYSGLTKFSRVEDETHWIVWLDNCEKIDFFGKHNC